MTGQPLDPRPALQIQKPCPMRWGDLRGDDKKRYCSECCLHVHNSAQLSQAEARALVSDASERVCMRIEYDPSGAPVFRDTRPAEALAARGPRSRALRLTRWMVTAAASVLAACQGGVATPPSNGPETGAGNTPPPSKMGKVCSTEIVGDVALPPPGVRETLGEAVVGQQPPAPVEPKAPPAKDEK